MMLTITNKHNKKTILEAFVNEERNEILLIDSDIEGTYSLTNATNDEFLKSVYHTLRVRRAVEKPYDNYRFHLQGTDGIVSEWENGMFRFVRYA